MIKLEFEGTDGAGKTTALKYFIKQAKAKGLTVVETREVGNPNIPICVKLREVVLDPNSNLSGAAMELIFSAIRLENDKWLQSLQNSANPPYLVVSDRGWLSHLAYTDHNVTPDFTEALYTDFLANMTAMPDIVLYFQVSTETALKRRVKRGETMDVIEMKGIEYQNLVRYSFLTHIENETNVNPGMEVLFIDANQSIDEVRADMDAIVEDLATQIKGQKEAANG